ncbi:MAG TPA: hypothetical protein VFP67_12260 [Acidimicrobiia bacterium]|nr:hypothetical protein [Acidimicrobiia bacterium]
MSGFHETWGYIAAGISGVVGLWGVIIRRRVQPPTAFWFGVGLAIAALLVQVVVGIAWMRASGIDPGDQHVFYGVLIAVTFSFAYIYRAQFRKSPALYYGLLLLFAMGLAIRGMTTVGVDF